MRNTLEAMIHRIASDWKPCCDAGQKRTPTQADPNGVITDSAHAELYVVDYAIQPDVAMAASDSESECAGEL